MQCLKCGRDCEQSFCPECQERMKPYPVKPGTVVTLPNRKAYIAKTVKKKPQITPEMRIEQLQRVIRRLLICIAVLFILFGAACGAAYGFFRMNRAPVIGQNYSTVTQPTTAASDSAD